MFNPFSDFPREYACPNRVGLLNSMEDLIRKLNIHNHKTTFFTSLYSFTELNPVKNRGIYSSAVINKIFLDSDKHSLAVIKSLHQYCMDKDYIHCFFFSGRGFHYYIGATGELKNKKGAVTNAQMKICDDLKFKLGANGDSDIDSHVIGNLAQLVRVPNSYNIKRKAYCIPLKKSDLTTIEHVVEKAQKPQLGISVYGHKYLDLTPFDSEPILQEYDVSVESPGVSLSADKVNKESFPVCIRSIMTDRLINHKERYYLIVYLRDLGLDLSSVIEFLRKNLSSKEFSHCVLTERQPYFIFKRNDLVFPHCDTLFKEGVCKNDGKCRGTGL